MNHYFSERLTLATICALLAIAVSALAWRKTAVHDGLIGWTTPLITAVLLLYYYLYVTDPSHGSAIMVLPLASGWILWRRRQTGKPSLSAAALALFQVLFACLYMLMIWLQEH